MENAEKVQEISPELMGKNPEEVQQEAESSVKEETPQPEIAGDSGAPEPEPEVTDEAKPGQQEKDSKENIKVPDEVVADLAVESNAVEKEVEQDKVKATKKASTTKAKKAKKEATKDSTEEDPEKAKVPKATKSKKKEKPEAPAEKETTDVESASEDSNEAQTREVEEIEEDLDFSNATKEDLLKKLKEIDNEERIHRVDRVLKAVRPRFDEIFESEKLSALNKYELEGNDPDSFEFHGDGVDKEFNSLYSKQRSKRNRYYKDQENLREENLKKKEHLLEQLRELVDGEESSTSINTVKEIQSDWKNTGPVPGAHNKTLWANYNALLDRFYDQRSIYFELKDLDRKKNLKIKEEICERAESLATNEDLKVSNCSVKRTSRGIQTCRSCS